MTVEPRAQRVDQARAPPPFERPVARDRRGSGAARHRWFSVGDSRVYQENGGYLGQMTVDDSPGPLRVRRHAAATDEPGHPVPGRPCGRWLLCSDGLSDLVDVATIERTLREESDEVRAVKALWVEAMNASGRDNISVMLLSADG